MNDEHARKVEYFEAPHPKPITYGTRGLLGLCLVMIAALMLAFIYAAWRVW